MNKILEDMMSILVVDDDLAASYLLDSPLGEKLVYGVCRGLEEVAAENDKTIEETVKEIIEEYEENEE